jgi:hypothetical protein
LAQLPFGHTVAVVAVTGGSAVAAMLWLERSGPPALPNFVLALVLLAACSLSATLCAIVAGRIVLAFGRRLILALAAAIAAAADVTAPRRQRLVPVVAAGRRFPLLAAGRGLRAPPAFVR